MYKSQITSLREYRFFCLFSVLLPGRCPTWTVVLSDLIGLECHSLKCHGRPGMKYFDLCQVVISLRDITSIMWLILGIKVISENIYHMQLQL